MTLQSKGPNPFETNTASPRYTELSRLKGDWVRAGLFSDAAAFYGSGHEFIYGRPQSIETDAAVGDTVLLGNRMGKIQTILKDDDDNFVGYEVYEDLRALPLDYSDDAEGYGYASDNTKVGRKVNYILAQGAEETGILNGNINQAVTPGSLIVLKNPTTNEQTWPKIAQDAQAFLKKFVTEFPVFTLLDDTPVFTEGSATTIKVLTNGLWVVGATVKVYIDGTLSSTYTTNSLGEVVIDDTFTEGEEITIVVTKKYHDETNFGPYTVAGV